jgi:hypothetical protein
VEVPPKSAVSAAASRGSVAKVLHWFQRKAKPTTEGSGTTKDKTTQTPNHIITKLHRASDGFGPQSAGTRCLQPFGVAEKHFSELLSSAPDRYGFSERRDLPSSAVEVGASALLRAALLHRASQGCFSEQPFSRLLCFSELPCFAELLSAALLLRAALLCLKRGVVSNRSPAIGDLLHS